MKFQNGNHWKIPVCRGEEEEEEGFAFFLHSTRESSTGNHAVFTFSCGGFHPIVPPPPYFRPYELSDQSLN